MLKNKINLIPDSFLLGSQLMDKMSMANNKTKILYSLEILSINSHAWIKTIAPNQMAAAHFSIETK